MMNRPNFPGLIPFLVLAAQIFASPAHAVDPASGGGAATGTATPSQTNATTGQTSGSCPGLEGPSTGAPPTPDVGGTTPPGPGGNTDTTGTAGTGGHPSVGRAIRTVINSFSGTSPALPTSSNMLTLQNAMMLSQLAKGSELTQAAYEKGVALKQAEEHDQQLLNDQYKNVSAQELSTRLQRAESELSRLGKALDSGKVENLETSEQARYRNAFLNAADKAEIARKLLQNSDGGAGLAKNPDLAELFSKLRYNDQDSLADRLLMLNGLLEKDRQALLSRLALAESVRVVLPNGETKDIPLLHNGYLNTSGRSEMDCPTFVAATLSPKFRKMNLTTMDLRGIWSLSRTGSLPKDVKWGKGRNETLQKISHGFEAVDIYIGEKPQPGDILVHRIPWQANGRVVIVKSYDPKRRVARVAEPSIDSARLIEFDFPLTDSPNKTDTGTIRPGLADLRLVGDDNSACRYNRASLGPRKPGPKR